MRAVTTPGIMRVFGEAHAGFGKLPWAELFAPAISHAETGWMIRPHVSTMFTLDETAYGRLPMVKKLALTEDGRKLYLRPDGTPKRVGDEVRNPDLAETLRGLARDGAESFYTGEIARRIAEDMRRHGGPMTLEDLASFKVQKRAPLEIAYRGRRIATPPPPGGGIMVAEMLRIIERFELATLEHNGPEYIRILAEAMKIAGLDKERHIGDPDFVPPPLERLLSDAYADECAERIRRGEKAKLTRLSSDCKDTTTVSCVDRERHGGVAHAHERRAVGRDPARHRLHAERRHELVRSAARPRRLDRARQAPLLLDDADHRVRRRDAGDDARRAGRRLDRRRHPAGSASTCSIGA